MFQVWIGTLITNMQWVPKQQKKTVRTIEVLQRINRLQRSMLGLYSSLLKFQLEAWRLSTLQKTMLRHYVTCRIMHISGIETAKTADFALVESHLKCGLAVWEGATAINVVRFLKHQKRAIKVGWIASTWKLQKDFQENQNPHSCIQVHSGLWSFKQFILGSKDTIIYTSMTPEMSQA